MKILIIISFIIFLGSCNKDPDTTVKSVTQSAPEVPEPERQRIYDLDHIIIDVSFDRAEKEVAGKVRTKIIPLSDNFREFEVDAVGFKDITVKDTNNSELKYEYNGKKIKIDAGKNYTSKDTIEYIVNYTCQPQRGLFFVYPTELEPSLPYQIWSQGGPEDNRFWIPVYDYPNDKTTFEVYITVEDKFKTLSNGFMESSEKVPGTALRKDHWVMNKPNSTYLIMIAAGEFTINEKKLNEIPVQSYTDRNVSLEDAEYTFRNTSEMIKVFESRFDYKYPWSKYAQMVAEDFIYPGMENTTATILFSRAIYNREVEKNYSSDELISHELSHQWFGNLITCRNWSEMWLNESFGTYSSALWAENYSGNNEYDYMIFRNGEIAMETEITSGRYPVWAGYGSIPANHYQKGSVILNTFRYILGDTVFFKTLNNFLTEYEYKNIVTQDFVDVMNKTDNESKGTDKSDFKWMFDQWIFKAGYPEFDVNYSYDENEKKVTLNVKQVQTTDTLTPVFRTPLNIRLKNSSEDITERIEIMDNDETFYFEMNSKPEMVVFDQGNKILDKTFFDKPLQEWIAHYKLSEDAIDRIFALRGIEIFLKEDTSHTQGKPVINYGQTEALKLYEDALQADEYWGVRIEAAKILSDNFILDRTSTVLKESYEIQSDPKVKREILKALGKSDRTGDVNFIKDKILNEKDNYIVTEGIVSLSTSMPASEIYDFVEPYSDRVSNGNIVQAAVIQALDTAANKTNDIRVKNKLMEFAFGIGTEGRTRTLAVQALWKYAKDPDVIAQAIKYADYNFIFVKAALIRMLALSQDKSAIPVLTNLKERSTYDGMTNMLSWAIKKLEKSN